MAKRGSASPVRLAKRTMPTDYGFTGQHADAVTGLDYYNARYYDPVAGQFTSADSLLPGDGYDVFGLSRYAYVEGNPVNRTDLSGHEANWIGPIQFRDPLPIFRVLTGGATEAGGVAGVGAAAAAEGGCIIAEPCGAAELVAVFVVGSVVVVVVLSGHSGESLMDRKVKSLHANVDPATATNKRKDRLQRQPDGPDDNWVPGLKKKNEVDPHLGATGNGTGEFPPGPPGRIWLLGLLAAAGGLIGLYAYGSDPGDPNIYRSPDDQSNPSGSPPSQPNSKQKEL